MSLRDTPRQTIKFSCCWVDSVPRRTSHTVSIDSPTFNLYI